MKRLVLVVVIGAIVWAGYQRVHAPDPMPRVSAAPQNAALELVERPEPSAQSTSSNTSSFRCDGRTHCSQMTSCEEATFFLQNCPGVKMDGEGDGIPCERQWCGN